MRTFTHTDPALPHVIWGEKRQRHTSREIISR